MSDIPEPSLDPVYEEEWQPAEQPTGDDTLPLPRAWGRSTGRAQKLA
jgi:hypothetical protein